MEAAIVELAQTRAKLAKLAGRPSYAHMRMQGHSLAQSPAAVSAYVDALHRQLGSAARDDADALVKFARQSMPATLDYVDWEWASLQKTVRAVAFQRLLPDGSPAGNVTVRSAASCAASWRPAIVCGSSVQLCRCLSGMQ